MRVRALASVGVPVRENGSLKNASSTARQRRGACKDFEVAQQHRLAIKVIAARSNGEPLALRACCFLMLADVVQVENDAAGTLTGTLIKF